MTTTAYATRRYPVEEEAELAIPGEDGRNSLQQQISSHVAPPDLAWAGQAESNLDSSYSFEGIVGRDPKMLSLFKLIRDLSGTDFSAVISGESGTGKELVARAIHRQSNRRNRPFIAVNCGAIPDGMFESELFGHVKGSFTGAIRDRRGRFELADTGTLFFDEITELSPQMQVKLLRVLQEGSFEPLGSECTRHMDVRILCATNRNLKDLVDKGSFREDLYYRLAVVPVNIPPLRERRNDISLIARHILAKAAEKTGKDSLELSADAQIMIHNYGWPGNVRQLQNAISYATIKSHTLQILPEHLPAEIQLATRQNASGGLEHPRLGRRPKLTCESVEFALVKTGGNKAKAARYLNIGRATLYTFCNAHKEFLHFRGE